MSWAARSYPWTQGTGATAVLAHGGVAATVLLCGWALHAVALRLPNDCRDYFIRNLHDALSGHTSNSVEEAIAYSEQSKTRCIGITIETRPDYCLKPHLNSMLSYGCTRIEIGVQVRRCSVSPALRLWVGRWTARLPRPGANAEYLRGRGSRHQPRPHGSCRV